MTGAPPEEPSRTDRSPAWRWDGPLASLGSTFISLLLVTAALLVVRWLLPPLLEASRYAWYRGQLRAEHEAATHQLQQVSLDGLSRLSQLVSQRVTPSVVHIDIKQSSLNEEELEALRSVSPEASSRYRIHGQGSGVLVDAAGYVITNFHVLEGCESIEVRFSDGSREEATLVGIDRARDLAVLKVPPVALPAANWGDSDAVTVGAPVWAVGSPFGLAGSVTFGILSSKHRVDLAESQYEGSQRLQARYSDLMQSDVAVNPGNSGGPLVNGQGEIIGINTAIVGETFQGVSFSIPSRLVREIYEDILAAAAQARGWLGVRLDPVSGDQPRPTKGPQAPAETSGAMVVDFVNFGHSPARAAGLRRGDTITGVDGNGIQDHRDLITRIAAVEPNTKVRLQVQRGSTSLEIDVMLGARFVELGPP
jgi:serine protease Do